MKIAVFVLMVMQMLAGALSAAGWLEKADSLYDLRAANFNIETLLAGNAFIDSAIVCYMKAYEKSSGSDKAEACWKLMRAYYFKGNHTTRDKEARKRIYETGKQAGEAGLKDFPAATGIHVWMAVLWGVWGEEHGLIEAAKKGVAEKMKYYCEKVIELDDNYDEGAGYRLLGRLHFKAPKIPILLGWPSKKEAVRLLEKSYKISQSNLFTKQFLAEALYKIGEKQRAVGLMNEILDTKETVEGIAEDAVIKKEVTDVLKEWEHGN